MIDFGGHKRQMPEAIARLASLTTGPAEELLHKQIAGHKSNASALIDEFLDNGTQKVRFSAVRISESQNIFSSVQEGTVQKRID